MVIFVLMRLPGRQYRERVKKGHPRWSLEELPIDNEFDE
jgi:hypothetical protein